jgi:hypothetical protein
MLQLYPIFTASLALSLCMPLSHCSNDAFIPALQNGQPREAQEDVFEASAEPAEWVVMRSQHATKMLRLHDEARMRLLCSWASEVLDKGRGE